MATCLRLLALQLAALPAAAAANSLTVWPTPVNQHLHQDSILHVLHDVRDELWVATLDGVTRFRGNFPTHYQYLSSQQSGSRRARVTGLVEVWDDRLVVATLGAGLQVFDHSRGDFSPLPWGDGQQNDDLQIAELHAAEDGQIWLGREDGSLVRLQRNGHYQRLPATINAGRVSDIAPLPGDGAIASTLAGHLRWLSQDGEEQRVVDSGAHCGLDKLEEILPLPDGSILLGSRGAGLWHLVDEDTCHQATGFAGSPLSHSTIHVLSVAPHDPSLIMAGTDQGLLILDRDGVRQHLHSGNSRLQDNEVISVTQAADGLAWIGTYDGLYLLDHLTFEHYDNEQHAGLQAIAGITSLPSGDIILGAYHGLLVRRGADHLPARAAGLSGALHNRSIMGVYRQDDRLFIAYRDAGLDVLQLASGEVSRLSADTTPALPSNAISAVLKTGDGNTLIGTYGGGLSLLTPEGTVETFQASGAPGSLLDNRVLLLFQSSDRQLWVGTESGLQKFDERHRRFEQLAVTGDQTPTPAPLLWTATETGDRELWFGSLHEGLWQVKNGKLHPASVGSQGEQTIYALEADAQGRIWYTSNQGLNVLLPDGGHRNYSSGFGLDNMEFELGSSHRDSTGRLYFGSNQGYFHFHPDRVPLAGRGPAVALTHYRLADNRPRAMEAAAANGHYRIALGRADYLVSLDYSALEYREPDAVRYRHRLRGLDPDWIEAGSARRASYTNLPPGTYHFDVQATLGTDFSLAPVSSARLVVPPPLWLSPWAFAGYLAGAVALVWLIRRLHRANIRRHDAELRAFESEAAAGRMADELQRHHLQQMELTAHLHAQQRHLLNWALPVGAGQLSRHQRRELRQFIVAADRHTVARHTQLTLDLHTLVNVATDQAGPEPAGWLMVNECPASPLPWQAAMAIGISLWCILNDLHEMEDGGQALLTVTARVMGLEPGQSVCELCLKGDFHPPLATPGTEALHRLARQVLEASQGSLIVGDGLIKLRVCWPEAAP